MHKKRMTWRLLATKHLMSTSIDYPAALSFPATSVLVHRLQRRNCMRLAFSVAFILAAQAALFHQFVFSAEPFDINSLPAGTRYCPAPGADNTPFMTAHFGIDAETGKITKYEGTVHPDETPLPPEFSEEIVLYVSPPISVENIQVPYPGTSAPVPPPAYGGPQINTAGLPSVYDSQAVVLAEPVPPSAYENRQPVHVDPLPYPAYDRQPLARVEPAPAPAYDHRPATYAAPAPYPAYDSHPLARAESTPVPGYDNRPIPPAAPMPYSAYDNRSIAHTEPPLPRDYDARSLAHAAPAPYPAYDNRPIVPTQSSAMPVRWREGSRTQQSHDYGSQPYSSAPFSASAMPPHDYPASPQPYERQSNQEPAYLPSHQAMAAPAYAEPPASPQPTRRRFPAMKVKAKKKLSASGFSVPQRGHKEKQPWWRGVAAHMPF